MTQFSITTLALLVTLCLATLFPFQQVDAWKFTWPNIFGNKEPTKDYSPKEFEKYLNDKKLYEGLLAYAGKEFNSATLELIKKTPEVTDSTSVLDDLCKTFLQAYAGENIAAPKVKAIRDECAKPVKDRKKEPWVAAVNELTKLIRDDTFKRYKTKLVEDHEAAKAKGKKGLRTRRRLRHSKKSSE